MPGNSGAVNGTSTQSTRPHSNAVFSHMRDLQTSLSFKRSAANPSVQPKVASSESNPLVRQKRRGTKLSQLLTMQDTASLKKAKFQWVKGELLGKGSYAQVYLALNATTGEVMAVKQVELPQTVSDRSNSRLIDIMQALKFESNTLKDLDHANIVQYLGYEESPQYLSIFLEYVPGGTISSCLKKYGRFKQEITKSFTSQILAGLEYLHSKGILHRDLKADNILVEPTGVCKISDFGISKKADIHRGRAFTGMKGTVFWMAPEILSSDGKGYDVKVDIWSVGCIVLEMWTEERPWSGEELVPVMMKLFEHKQPPPLPHDLVLSESALDFRSQCFHMDPQKRPTAAELQKHPYLILPDGWRFEPTDLEHPRRVPSVISTKSRRSPRPNRHMKLSSWDSGQNIPPVPPLPASFPPGACTTPSLDMLIDGKHPELHQANPLPEHGPQLVFITPPSSPVPEFPQIGNDSEPSNVAGVPGLQRLKGFHVVNGDPEPGPNKLAFIYTPPPLPGVDSKTPYSARLVPSSLHHAPYSPPTPPPSSQLPPTHSTMWRPASYNLSAPGDELELPHRDSNDNDDSDDSDIGTSLWKRPPLDLSAERLKDSLGGTASARSSQIRRTIFRASSQHHEDDASWAPRPAPEEVYDHLQEFFPYHDLDKAIIEVRHVDSTPKPKFMDDKRRQTKKSIRMVAEEQINRQQIGMRRKTKLWDSNVEELRM